MVDAHEHGACVDAWLARAANGLPPDKLLMVFNQGFTALWSRAHQTLGDVTLMAIVDRVLYVAAERYPYLCALKVEPAGLRCQELQQQAGNCIGMSSLKQFGSSWSSFSPSSAP